MKIVDAQVHIWRQTVSQPTGKHRKVSLVSAEQMLKAPVLAPTLASTG